jgi:hypothetical protein
MEKQMEQDLLRQRPQEPQISVELQSIFLHHRQRQQEAGISLCITLEVRLIARAVLQWSSNPILTLRSMGIIFFGRTAAFNLSLLSCQIVTCRARVIAALRAENWEEVQSDRVTGIASVVGANEVKHWTVFNVPRRTELSEFLLANPKLSANEHSFGLDHAPHEVLIGPGLPPNDLLSEPHFPLVSIEYARAVEVYELATFAPVRMKARRDLAYTLCSAVTIDYEV